MSLAPGDRLDRYEIVGPLGAGGMGEVWRARDTELGREVAIKILPDALASNPSRLERFRREGRALASLSHPNLLTVYDIGLADGRPYSVAELLRGKSLRKVLRRGPCPAESAVAWGLEIARGLAAAHAKTIVHRDLKPDNIFLTRNNGVKILDFGLAKILEPGLFDSANDVTVSETTDIGTVLGTMGYMAPEQLRGEPVDTTTDVFALGCVLYEMLSGRRPFAGGSRAEQISSVLRDDPIPLPKNIPLTVRSVVRRCLEKRPFARYQGAGEVAAALETIDPASLADLETPGAGTPAEVSEGGGGATVAVMPLLNLSGDIEQEYLCDGMTEEILGAIGKVRGIRVLARSSGFAYKGTNADPRDVGLAIGADHLVEGSFRRLGERVRIAARLVQTSDGSQLWGDSYDRTVSDIFELQDEVSVEVANQLRTALLEDEVNRLRQRHTPDREANDLYMRGRFLWYRRREGDLQTAIAHFERAVEKDPEYAQPHAGIAEVLGVLGTNAYMDPKIAFARVRSRARSRLRPGRDRSRPHTPPRALLHGYHEFPLGSCRGELSSEPSNSSPTGATSSAGMPDSWSARVAASTTVPSMRGRRRRRSPWRRWSRPSPASTCSTPGSTRDSHTSVALWTWIPSFRRHITSWASTSSTGGGTTRRSRTSSGVSARASSSMPACSPSRVRSSDELDRVTEIETQLDEIAETRYVSHFTRATVALAKDDLEACLDCIDAAREQGEYEVIMIECLGYLAPLRSHPRYRRHLEIMGIPEGVR